MLTRIPLSALLLFSLGLYGQIAGWLGVAQLLLVAAVTYWLALLVDNASRARTKATGTIIGVTVLVLHLFAFKYLYFSGTANRTSFAHASAMDFAHVEYGLIPIGISFYTLQLISYLVDTYRGSAAERRFAPFVLAVAFFPKVVSGPIERTGSLISQFAARTPLTLRTACSSLELLVWGVFKKVAVADQLGPVVDRVYDIPAAQDGVLIVFATVVYAFQLYCDFSGYADMAVGAAGLLGFRLSPNFDRPYFATSLQEFWKRWHTSFSTWLTEYVYGPLLRQRWLRVKLYRLMLFSVIFMFVLSGVWHGLQLNFVAWGLLHGSYLVAAILLQQPWRRLNERVGITSYPRFYRATRITFTFSLVCSGYLFFRAKSLSDAWVMVTRLPTGWSEFVPTISWLVASANRSFLAAVAGTVFVIGSEAIHGRLDAAGLAAASPWFRLARVMICVGAVLFAWSSGSEIRPFAYYQF